MFHKSPISLGTNGRVAEFIFALVLIVCLGLLIYSRLQFAHIPFERDEGEYAYVGQLIRHGLVPYRDAYNMKLPGTYFIYALTMQAGGETVEAIRYGTLIAVLITAAFIFLLADKWFNSFSGLLSATVYLGLVSTCGGEGIMSNCEHFVMLFAVAGIYFLFYKPDFKSPVALFISGLLLGCCVLMKQQGYAFVLFALFIIVRQFFKKSGTATVKSAIAFCSGGLIPVALLLIYIAMNGIWKEFKFLTIDYATEYIKICTAGSSKWMWNNSLALISNAAKPLWQAVLYASIGLLLPFKIVHRFKLILLLACSYLAVSAGGYFRVHYFTLAYFSLALAFTAVIYSIGNINRYLKTALQLIACSIIIAFLIINKQSLFPHKALDVYLEHYAWSGFADMPKIADEANRLLKKDEKLAMFSNEPQIYFFANRVGASPFLYTYPFYEKQKYAVQMANDYISEINKSGCSLFLYNPNKDKDNNGGRKVIDDWWARYQKDFELQSVFWINTAGGIRYLQKAELQTDTAWRDGPCYQFWVRKL